MNADSSNTLCIKKSAGKKNCKIKKNPKSEAAFNELQSIFTNKPENMQEKMQEKISNAVSNPSHKSLQELIKNYYNMSNSEQEMLLQKLSSVTDVPGEYINSNIPKLIYFVKNGDSPNYDIIANIKQLGMEQQKTYPEKQIITNSNNSLPIPAESEINYLNLISKFNNLNSSQQSQLINSLSNYSGVTPEYIKQDLPIILNSINSGNINNSGIYNKIQSMYQRPAKNVKPVYPMNIPKVETLTNKMETNSEVEQHKMLGNMGNNPDGVYIDLGCFMNNMGNLKNHTDHMMIDLSLLLSNIKSCSYVKKNKHKHKHSPHNTNVENIVNKITSKIEIPQPDIVKLNTVHANLLVSTSENSNNQLLEIMREPFNSESSSSKSSSNEWSIYDLIKIIIIIIILSLLIFRK